MQCNRPPHFLQPCGCSGGPNPPLPPPHTHPMLQPHSRKEEEDWGGGKGGNPTPQPPVLSITRVWAPALRPLLAAGSKVQVQRVGTAWGHFLTPSSPCNGVFHCTILPTTW